MTAAPAIQRPDARPAGPGTVPMDFIPQDDRDFAWAIQDPWWRICSGALYKIMTKVDEFDDGSMIPFVPNPVQRDVMAKLHYRNVILKSRQHGVTTLMCILSDDHAIFGGSDQRCGIIAHSRTDAEVIFRDKVRLTYEHLPEYVRKFRPIKSLNASEILFDNNSGVRVGTSMRSGTLARLHVSEMGKIGKAYPQKAREIVTGSFPTVSARGMISVESTAEGRSGEFFNMATRAERRAQFNRPLGPKEWKFHFYGWQDDPRNTVSPSDPTPITSKQHERFDEVARETGKKITLGQRKWYVSTLENEQGGDTEKMWQEHPATPEDCWRRSVEGTFYARQMARARAEGRIGKVPFVSNVPVFTFWDIGSGDGTAIWLMQRVGLQHRFPLFIEGWGEGYGHYVRALRETGQVFGGHYLPHDVTHERQLKDTVGRPLDFLYELAPDWTFNVVPRVRDLQHGIQMTRDILHTCWFDEEGCAAGINHLDLYHKKFVTRTQVWSDEPEKNDGHSEAADAIRQMAQGFDAATGLSNPYDDLERARANTPTR